MLDSVVGWLYRLTRSPAINWKVVLISGSLLDLGFKTLLDIRQYRTQTRESPPEEVVKEGLVDDETFKKSQAYNRANLKFSIINRIFNFVLDFVVLKSDLLPKSWNYWLPIVSSSWLGGGSKAVVMGLLSMLTAATFRWFATLPFKYYNNFVIEENFGFNNYTRYLWFKDVFKMGLVNLFLLPPIVGAVAAIADYFGNWFPVYTALFQVFLNVILTFIVPFIIMPLFYKHTSLEDGELRTAIEELASSQKFPLSRIYVVDGSQQSSHSNAYFVGFPWYKQILLYDTLIKTNSTDEVVAVLAHELGHWKRNHMTVHAVLEILVNLPSTLALLLFLNNTQFFESLGFSHGTTPTVIALYVYMDALAPLNAAQKLLQNYVIRSCEYDADAFAVRLGKGKSSLSAIVALSKTNLSTYDSDPIYSTFYNSHPGLVDRLKAIKAEIKKLE